MSENKRQFETDTVINDPASRTERGTAAPTFRNMSTVANGRPSQQHVIFSHPV